MSSTLRLGTHSSGLASVVNAFEAELGLPLTAGPSVDFLTNVLRDYNAANDTNIQYDHEDYGYYFRLTETKESRLLGEIRQKYRLGGE
ncbi:hypothetical protein [Mycobacteroides chelonae]|uniref:hypothetical protein n=1 Tax=Mycobacteroides chelonae TaxID=1774 RepID=UPI0010420944|nr:hypothetical protein [Mycobacteroides chelonae]